MKYKVLQGHKVNPRKREVLGGGKQRVNGNLIKDNLIKTNHRKSHTSHQETKQMFFIRKNLVCHICNSLQGEHKKTIDCPQSVVNVGIGNVIVGLPHGVSSVPQKHMQHKPAEDMQPL